MIDFAFTDTHLAVRDIAREIHMLMQADYVLGQRVDKLLERDLPPVV